MTGIILGIGNSAALFAPKGTPFDPKDVIELVDPEQPHVSVFDLSVLRGDGIFEATTVWKGFRSRWRTICAVSPRPRR